MIMIPECIDVTITDPHMQIASFLFGLKFANIIELYNVNVVGLVYVLENLSYFEVNRILCQLVIHKV